MRPLQWLRTLARWLLWSVQFAPFLALLFAILVDEGPTGEPRLSSHFFPVVLWVFDDFAWTCARNSLIFAIVVSVSSLVVGVGLQAALCRLPHWGRSILGAAVLTVVAASPAFLALGLTGLFGQPRPLPWPFWSSHHAGSQGASLESWSGLSLWLMWIWSSVPAGAAIVALLSAGAFRRLDPTWGEAARLGGAARTGSRETCTGRSFVPGRPARPQSSSCWPWLSPARL